MNAAPRSTASPVSSIDVKGVDTRLLRALAHPLRLQILELLSGRVACPKELADELGVPLGRLSYHVRVLAEGGWLELVSTQPRRGAVAHFYKATLVDELVALARALGADIAGESSARPHRELGLQPATVV